MDRMDPIRYRMIGGRGYSITFCFVDLFSIQFRFLVRPIPIQSSEIFRCVPEGSSSDYIHSNSKEHVSKLSLEGGRVAVKVVSHSNGNATLHGDSAGDEHYSVCQALWQRHMVSPLWHEAYINFVRRRGTGPTTGAPHIGYHIY